MDDLLEFVELNEDKILNDALEADISKDCVEGSGSLEITALDEAGKVGVEFELLKKDFNVNNTKGINLQIKPYRNARWIEFYAKFKGGEKRLILIDNDLDGRCELENDFKSGVWNKINLDMLRVEDLASEENNDVESLIIRVNEDSIWKFDDIKMNEAGNYSVDLDKYESEDIVLNNGELKLKEKDGKYEKGNVITTKAKKNQFIKEFDFSNNPQTMSMTNGIVVGESEVEMIYSPGVSYPHTVFDKDPSTNMSYYRPYMKGWIGISSSEPISISSLTLLEKNSRNVLRGILQCSNDGENWENVMYLNNMYENGRNKTYKVYDVKIAKKWRIIANDSGGKYSTWELNSLSFHKRKKGEFLRQGIEINNVSKIEKAKLTISGSEIYNLDTYYRYSEDDGETWSEFSKTDKYNNMTEIIGKSIAKSKFEVKLLTKDGVFVSPVIEKINIEISGAEEKSTDSTYNKNISRIYIDSNYEEKGNRIDELKTSKFFENDYAKYNDKFNVSRSGRYIFNLNESNKSMYVQDTTTGKVETYRNYGDDRAQKIYTSYDDKAYYEDRYRNLVNKTGSKTDMESVFYISNSGSIIQYDSYSDELKRAGAKFVTAAQNGTRRFFTAYNSETKRTKLYMGDKMILETVRISHLKANLDGSMIAYENNKNIYLYNVDEGYTRKLNLNKMQEFKPIKFLLNNKILLENKNTKFNIYNLATDEITELDTPGISGAEKYLSDDGSKLTYRIKQGSNYGYKVKYLDGTDIVKYLMIFNNSGSWYSYKNNRWVEVTDKVKPSKEDFDKYGMTKDEINSMSEDDLDLYNKIGKDVYQVDFAIHINSPDVYTTPVIKEIKVFTKDRDGEAEVKSMYAKKSLTYDASNWRTISRIYPVEITKKNADIYYFIKLDGEYVYYENGTWKTADDMNTWLSDMKGNWNDIKKVGMSAYDLKFIPASKLSSKLVGKEFKLEYVMNIEDTSTNGYSSKITIDFTNKMFGSNSLTLNITYSDGTLKKFTELSNSDIEDFMTWLNRREYGIGETFKKIKVGNIYKFINYNMIREIEVEEAVAAESSMDSEAIPVSESEVVQ
jgi:hypothetical protein